MFIEILKKMFEVYMFFCLCSWNLPAFQAHKTEKSLCVCVYLSGVFGVEVESVSATEGDSVSLLISVTEEQRTDEIEWRFRNILIAKLIRKNDTSTFFNDAADGRFRGRLKLDSQTGSLTITNSRISDSGLYNVTSYKTSKSLFKFNCTVYAPVPVIRNSSQCSSSSSLSVQYCSVVCLVVNVSAGSLSWYKGNSVLSSISVSDLSISVSLPLEVEFQDNNTYSCVIDNTISNYTTHLNINTLCQPCKAVTHAEEITYADPTFHRRKAPKSSPEETTYADPTSYRKKAQKSGNFNYVFTPSECMENTTAAEPVVHLK
ncbi:SLAM family member 9-like [Danio aesculapii]|uniref:SLAM family member 9-like n=1 Tax=Danio aesculapii TaxID=1142201 RepID=UPI0024C04152|nr:SLAM family member 9-like [Danio aesculapii]